MYKVLTICFMFCFLQGCNTSNETVDKPDNGFTQILSFTIPNISEQTDRIESIVLQVTGTKNINELSSVLLYLPSDTSCNTDEIYFLPDINNRMEVNLYELESCIGDLTTNITLKMQLTFHNDIDWVLNSSDFYMQSYVYDVDGEIIRFTNGISSSYSLYTHPNYGDVGRLSLPMPFSGENYDFIYYPNYIFSFDITDVSQFITSSGINGGLSVNDKNQWGFSYDFYDYTGDQYIDFKNSIPGEVKVETCFLTSRTTGAIFKCPW